MHEGMRVCVCVLVLENLQPIEKERQLQPLKNTKQPTLHWQYLVFHRF